MGGQLWGACRITVTKPTFDEDLAAWNMQSGHQSLLLHASEHKACACTARPRHISRQLQKLLAITNTVVDACTCRDHHHMRIVRVSQPHDSYIRMQLFKHRWRKHIRNAEQTPSGVNNGTKWKAKWCFPKERQVLILVAPCVVLTAPCVGRRRSPSS